MCALRSPKPLLMLTSYFPSAAEYRPVKRASRARQALRLGVLVVLIAAVIYDLVNDDRLPKPTRKARTPAAPKPDTDRAKREQAALIEEAQRHADKTREVVRQNPAKDGVTW